MLHVAIVDDDNTIRSELKRMLEVLKGKCKVVLEAEDGDQIENSPLLPDIDLILTDINMRRVGGIELIRSIKQRWPAMEMVVLSNYDDFLLVRDAMKCGASDYLLKYQLTPEALDSLIELTFQKKERKHRVEEIPDIQMKNLILSNFLKDFLNRRVSVEEFLCWLDSLEPQISHMNASLFLIYTKEEANVFLKLAPGLREKLECEPYCYFWEHCPGCLAVVVFTHHCSTQMTISENYLFSVGLLQEFLPEYRKLVTVCRSETLLRLDSLPDEMDSLLECGGNIFYIGTGMVLDRSCLKQFTSLDRPFFCQIRGELLDSIQKTDASSFEKAVSRMVERMKQDKCRPEEVKEFLIGLFRNIGGNEHSAQEDIFWREAEKKLKSHLCTVEDVYRIFTKLWELVEKRENEGVHTAIHQAMKLIEKKYHTELTLEQVARACGYHKNYFCRLFKETYGCSFVEYLTRYRMEKAWKLLQEEFIPVNQMAQQVGMEYRQFCRTFKKFYHSTPSDCIERLHRERQAK